MSFTEQAFVFDCAGEAHIGIAALPNQNAERGVLVLVGGPQYRIGSHRQFVLLSRQLAAQGVACMRFDFRGMGDSGGAARAFERSAEEIRLALDQFFKVCPSLRRIVLWGLCDAATAAALYAPSDARVSGLVLLNPWVRTEVGESRVYLRHYYLRRFAQGEFWRKLLRGEWHMRQTVRDLNTFARRALGKNNADADASPSRASLPQQMGEGLARFGGPVLLFLSGQDYTAAEFDSAAHQHAALREGLSACQVSWSRIAAANHTFSGQAWREQVERETAAWLTHLP